MTWKSPLRTAESLIKYYLSQGKILGSPEVSGFPGGNKLLSPYRLELNPPKGIPCITVLSQMTT